MAENATLEESIKTAVETEARPSSGAEDKKEPVVTEKTEPVEKDKEEKTDDKPTLSEAEQAQALQLFAALKDPIHSKTVIEFLAKQAGIGETEKVTKEEIKEVKKGIVETLKESLGPDLDYLAEKLGPVIENVVNAKVKEGTDDLRAAQATSQQEKLAGEANQAMSAIAKSQFNKDVLPDDIVTEMNKVMDQIDPKPGMSVKDYIEFAYYFVAGKKGIKTADTSQEDRRAKNRTDAPSRLASEGRREPVAQESATFTTLHGAIEAAIKQVAEQEK